MTPEQILSIKPKMLTQKQREFYFENGYILLEKLLSDEWIERLRAATDEMVDRSRGIDEIGCRVGPGQGTHRAVLRACAASPA